jgi:putative ABC transport system permease protein
MVRLTLASLWSRRRRLIGTAAAVVIGVAFLFGTLLLGDTLGANFDRLFTQVSADTDVVVRNATETSSEPDAIRGLIDESLLPVVRDVDGVQHAEAQVVGYGSLLGRDGEAIGGNGPPRLAGSWITDPALNPYELVEGRAPREANEVVVNRGAADAGDLERGDSTIVQTPDPVRVTIVGIATFGDLDGLGETTWTAFTLGAAQDNVTGQPDKVNTILVKGAPDVSSTELRSRIADALPSGVEAITGSQLTDEQLDALTFLDIIRAFLIVFAGIALVVAALTINNAFSITVAQRTRELSLLRVVGASRRQLRRSVTIEALAIGIGASLVGIVGGFGVASGLKAAFDAFGGALPDGGLTVRPLAVAIALAVGLFVPFVAARLPARRAAATPPLAALRDVEHERIGQIGRRGRSGFGVLVAGVAAGLLAPSGDGLLLVAALAAVLVVTGALMVAPAALPPIATAFGTVLARVRGVTARFAVQNARRNPRRSAATATALVVGIAVVSLITVLVASLKATVDRDVTDAFRADLVVNTEFFGGSQLSPRALDELRASPVVDRAVGVAETPILLDGDSTVVTATDTDDIGSVATIDTASGSLDALGGHGIAVERETADDKGWTRGTRLDATFSDGATERVTVDAIYESNALLGDVVIPSQLWMDHTAQPTLRRAFVDTAEGVTAAAARQSLTPIAERYGAEVQDLDEYATVASGGLDLLLAVVYVLLALAIVIALLGIANTLSLAVYERRREIGLLRAVGETRRQVHSILRLESVLVSSFGTLLGLALGGFLGWVLFATASDGGTFSLPIGSLLVVAVGGALAGVIAAWRPARRAARTPVLDAIAAT